MKTIKTISLLSAIFLHQFVAAQDAAVLLQHGGKPTVFVGNAALADAHTAAVNGDTIYLGRGYWGPISISKSLHIYGAGISVDSTLATGKSGINGTITLIKGANNCHLEGFEITGDINIAFYDSINQVSLLRLMANTINIGTYGGKGRNISIAECVLKGNIIGNDNVSNIVIRNNIVAGLLATMSNAALIENNIIWYQNPYSQTIQGVNNAVIRNNVFLFNQSCCYGIMSGSGNVFHNNVVPYFSGYPAGTDTLKNYYGLPLDSVLVKPTIPFSWTGNYHVKPALSAKLKGNDGTEVGIYGGRFGIAKEGWVPIIPHIQTNNVDANTDNNGKLKVQIKVQAQKR